MKLALFAACVAAAALATAANAELTGSNLTFSPPTGDNDTHFVAESARTTDGFGNPGPGTRSMHWTLKNQESNFTYNNVAFLVPYVYVQIAGSEALVLAYDGPVGFDYANLAPDASASTKAGQWSGTLVGGSYDGNVVRAWAWSSSPELYFDTVSPGIPGISPGYVFPVNPPLKPFPNPELDYSKAYPIVPVAASLGPLESKLMQDGILQFKTVNTTTGQLWHQMSGSSSFNIARDYVGVVVPEPAGLTALLAGMAGLAGRAIRRR